MKIKTDKKEFNLQDLPVEYKELFANRLYNNLLDGSESYTKDSINTAIEYFSECEKYEFCKKLLTYI